MSTKTSRTPFLNTRDLLRRRLHLVRKQGRLSDHIQSTNHQYDLPAFGKRIRYPANREGVAEHFDEAVVRKSIELDLALLERTGRFSIVSQWPGSPQPLTGDSLSFASTSRSVVDDGLSILRPSRA